MARVQLMLLEFSSASTVNFTVLEVQCWNAAACSQAQQTSLSDSSSRLVSRWLVEFWSLEDLNSFYDFSYQTPKHLGHFVCFTTTTAIINLEANGSRSSFYSFCSHFPLSRLVALFSAADTVIDISRSQSVSVSVLCFSRSNLYLLLFYLSLWTVLVVVVFVVLVLVAANCHCHWACFIGGNWPLPSLLTTTVLSAQAESHHQPFYSLISVCSCASAAFIIEHHLPLLMMIIARH